MSETLVPPITPPLVEAQPPQEVNNVYTALAGIAIAASLRYGTPILSANIPQEQKSFEVSSQGEVREVTTPNYVSGDQSLREALSRADVLDLPKVERENVSVEFMEARRHATLNFLGLSDLDIQQHAEIIDLFELRGGQEPYDALEHVLLGDVKVDPEQEQVQIQGMHFLPALELMTRGSGALTYKEANQKSNGRPRERGVLKLTLQRDGTKKPFSDMFPSQATTALRDSLQSDLNSGVISQDEFDLKYDEGLQEATRTDTLKLLEWVGNAYQAPEEWEPILKTGEESPGVLRSFEKRVIDDRDSGLDLVLVATPTGDKKIHTVFPIGRESKK